MRSSRWAGVHGRAGGTTTAAVAPTQLLPAAHQRSCCLLRQGWGTNAAAACCGRQPGALRARGWPSMRAAWGRRWRAVGLPRLVPQADVRGTIWAFHTLNAARRPVQNSARPMFNMGLSAPHPPPFPRPTPPSSTRCSPSSTSACLTMAVHVRRCRCSRSWARPMSCQSQRWGRAGRSAGVCVVGWAGGGGDARARARASMHVPASLIQCACAPKPILKAARILTSVLRRAPTRYHPALPLLLDHRNWMRCTTGSWSGGRSSKSAPQVRVRVRDARLCGNSFRSVCHLEQSNQILPTSPLVTHYLCSLSLPRRGPDAHLLLSQQHPLRRRANNPAGAHA